MPASIHSRLLGCIYCRMYSSYMLVCLSYAVSVFINFWSWQLCQQWQWQVSFQLVCSQGKFLFQRNVISQWKSVLLKNFALVLSFGLTERLILLSDALHTQETLDTGVMTCFFSPSSARVKMHHCEFPFQMERDNKLCLVICSCSSCTDRSWGFQILFCLFFGTEVSNFWKVF